METTVHFAIPRRRDCPEKRYAAACAKSPSSKFRARVRTHGARPILAPRMVAGRHRPHRPMRHVLPPFATSDAKAPPHACECRPTRRDLGHAASRQGGSPGSGRGCNCECHPTESAQTCARAVVATRLVRARPERRLSQRARPPNRMPVTSIAVKKALDIVGRCADLPRCRAQRCAREIIEPVRLLDRCPALTLHFEVNVPRPDRRDRHHRRVSEIILVLFGRLFASARAAKRRASLQSDPHSGARWK